MLLVERMINYIYLNNLTIAGGRLSNRKLLEFCRFQFKPTFSFLNFDEF